MPEIVEVAIWICIIALVFVMVTFPFKGTETKLIKRVERYSDATIQYVAKKPMLIDKRRWDATIN